MLNKKKEGSRTDDNMYASIMCLFHSHQNGISSKIYDTWKATSTSLFVLFCFFSNVWKTRRSYPNEKVPIMTKLSWDKKTKTKYLYQVATIRRLKQRAVHALTGHKVHVQASLHGEYSVRGYRDISSASANLPETNVMSISLILHSLMRPVNTPRTRSVYTLRAEYTRDGVRITDHAID